MNLHKLLTEQVNPASRDIDTKSTREVLEIINGEDRGVAGAVEKEIPRIAEAVDAIAARVRKGGRLFYIGAGTSGRLGVLDAAECPPTFHVPPELVQGIIAGGERALARATEATEDDPQVGKQDLLARGFSGGDALIGIAACSADAARRRSDVRAVTIRIGSVVTFGCEVLAERYPGPGQQPGAAKRGMCGVDARVEHRDADP